MLDPTLLEDGRFDTTQRELLKLADGILEAIRTGDAAHYAALCTADISCFEDVCAHRIDGLDFHTAMILRMASGTKPSPVRVDILEPAVRVYGDCGIVTFTRLLTHDDGSGPGWSAFNETRVFARVDGQWRMVHFHRSAA